MKNKQAKQMIESISKEVDLYGVNMLNLPWIDHPFSDMFFDYSKGRDCKVIKKAIKIASEKSIETINYFLEDGENKFDFDIVFNKRANSVFEGDLGYYVDQSGPGMCGDDYSGRIWIPITPKRFLTFQYAT